VTVKRPKIPVLTSPWKIGFFVSLMLVVVSAGVAYFFIRRSEFSGAIPEFTSWNSVVESIRPPDGAVIEFWPLLAIVGASTLLAYFLVTRAVRQYKGFLDSGYDYKNLLATIREIRDLEDKSRIEKLQNHPELRDFLLGIREMTAVRERDLDKREESLDKRASGNDDSEDFRKRLSLECDRLVDAIQVSGSNWFPETVELAIPQIQSIRHALRGAFASGQPSGGSQQFVGDASQLEDIARDLEAGIETAREIESDLRGGTPTGDHPSADTSTIRTEIEGLLKDLTGMQGISSQLDELDDEAKSVAINTALKAGSSEDTQTDLVQLADDVKEIAAKFGTFSESSMTLVGDVTGRVNAIEAELNRFLDSMDATSQRSEAIETTVGKASRWVEQLVVLWEKVNNAGEAMSARVQPEDKLILDDPGQPDDGLNVEQMGQPDDGLILERASQPDDALNVEQTGRPSGNLDLEQTGQPETKMKTEQPTQPAGSERLEATPRGFDVNDSGFEAIERVRPLFSDDPKGTAPAGIEKDSDQMIAEPLSEDGMFTELSEAASIRDDSIDRKTFPEQKPEPTKAPRAKTAGGSFELDGDTLKLPPMGRLKDTADPDVDDDVIDLYALGAVDYDPVVHN